MKSTTRSKFLKNLTNVGTILFFTPTAMTQTMRTLFILAFVLNFAHRGVAQNTEHLLQINSTEINVRVIGKGAPVMVVHGGPGLNHTYFLPHLQKLADTHKLIFIDQRSCGNSAEILDSAQMTLDWLIRDMEVVRSELNLGKVTVLAHSWGGLLGMLYASMYPESIRSLILVNSVSPKFGEFDMVTNRITISRYNQEDSALRAQILTSAALSSGDLRAYNQLFRLSFKQSFYDQRFIDSLNLILPNDFVQKRKALSFMSNELAAYDFYPDLKKIKCPTLILHGDYDAIPLELPQKIHRTITTSKLVVIQDAGHFPFIERNQDFVTKVRHFLQEND